MAVNEWQLKQQILDIGKRLWQREFIASNDGNISIRVDENEILTTPTGVSKGFMSEAMIVRVDMNGNMLEENDYKPSSEVKMHIEVYKQRNDINAVVHAHPPYATAFAVNGKPIDQNVLPEAVLTLGTVEIAPYGTPSTVEVPDSIRPIIQHSDAVLLANHGALTLGIDLITAYHRMETLEHTASIIHKAMQLGKVKEITQSEVRKLMEIRKKYNFPGRIHIPGIED